MARGEVDVTCRPGHMRLLLYMSVCVHAYVYTMCASNYSAENTPHSFGPVLAIELSICGCWKRRETGKGNSLLGLGARFLFFFSAQATAALGEIREDHGLEWVWT